MKVTLTQEEMREWLPKTRERQHFRYVVMVTHSFRNYVCFLPPMVEHAFHWQSFF